MPWVEIFAVFAVLHVVGDYALQTDWQAVNKRGGLGRQVLARRALFSHVALYAVSFVPAYIWLADRLGAGILLLALGIFVPHLIQDDGYLLSRYIRTVKGGDALTMQGLYVQIDQSFHLIVLFLTALAVHAAT